MGAKKGEKLNPTGKGGFKDNPGNINKNGRPKNEFTFANILEKVMGEKFLRKSEDGETMIDSGLLKKEALAEAAFRHAMKGNVGYFNTLLERLEGKIPDKLISESEVKIIKDNI